MDRLRISLLFCADASYFQHMGATMASLLQSNTSYDFQIYVCSEKRDPRAEEKLSAIALRFGNASITFLEFSVPQHCQLRIDRHITMASYLRLFLTEFLDPSVEKLLYLDCDLVVTGDIGELWHTDLGGAFLAAAPDPYVVTEQHWGFGPEDTYFNAGVLLIDVARWREANLLPVFLQFAEEHASVLECHDQDVLNHVFRGKVRFLDYRWNFQSRFAGFRPEGLKMSADDFERIRRLPPIVHFTTKYKPWIYLYEPHYTTLYNEALALTPWGKDRPPDRTPRSILLKILKMKILKERVRWYAPGVVRFLNKLSAR